MSAHPAPPRARLPLASDTTRAEVVVAVRDGAVAVIGPHDSIVVDEIPAEAIGTAVELLVPVAIGAHRGPVSVLTVWGFAVAKASIGAHVVDTISPSDPRSAGMLLLLGCPPRPRTAAIDAPSHVDSSHPAIAARLQVACDASVGRGRAGGGIAFVTADGHFKAAPVRSTSNVCSLELAAIELALVHLPLKGRRLDVTSDSQWAVRVCHGDLEPARAQDCARAARVRRMLGDRHRVRWVRGHVGDRLNEIADRLAKTVRRADQLGIGDVDTQPVLQRIAAEAAA